MSKALKLEKYFFMKMNWRMQPIRLKPPIFVTYEIYVHGGGTLSRKQYDAVVGHNGYSHREDVVRYMCTMTQASGYGALPSLPCLEVAQRVAGTLGDANLNPRLGQDPSWLLKETRLLQGKDLRTPVQRLEARLLGIK